MPTNAQSLTPSRPAPQSSRARQLAAGLLDLFDPNVRRLGLLPYPQGSLSGQKGPVEWSNWVAPQLAVDMVKAIELPGRAWRGEQISPDDVTKMAMDTMGGSGLLSRAVPTGNVGGLLGINVFHGGPHRWASEPGFPQGRPRMDKMGTGEGAQAYGHGFYGAEAKGVGQQYKQDLAGVRKFSPEASNMLSKVDNLGFDTKGQAAAAIRKHTDWAERWDVKSSLTKAEMQKLETELKAPFGTLYKLDIPDADAAKYLDWDAPFNEQPENVQAALKKSSDYVKGIFGKPEPEIYGDKTLVEKLHIEDRGDHLTGLMAEIRYNATIRTGPRETISGSGPTKEAAIEAARKLGMRQYTGRKAYADLEKKLGSREAASEFLRKAGIPGLKYFDQGSRGTREGTRNYVTWDQDVLDRIKILERDGKPNAY